MKNYTLLLTLFLLSFFSMQAQFTVKTEGEPIEDGQVFQFGSNEFPESNLEYDLINDASTEKGFQIKIINIENTSGDNFEVCLSYCYNFIEEGVAYPEGEKVMIPGGESLDATGVHAAYTGPADVDGGVATMEFQFQQYSADGELENTLNVVYEYGPNLSITDEDQDLGVTLNSTQISNGALQIENTQSVEMQMFSLLGKQVASQNFENGSNTYNVSNLSSGVYLLRFQNEQGQTKTQKVVIE